MKQKTMHVDSDPRDKSDAEAVSASSTTSLNFLLKKSLAKKLSIKNESEVNSDSFFDYTKNEMEFISISFLELVFLLLDFSFSKKKSPN